METPIKTIYIVAIIGATITETFDVDVYLHVGVRRLDVGHEAMEDVHQLVRVEAVSRRVGASRTEKGKVDLPRHQLQVAKRLLPTVHKQQLIIWKYTARFSLYSVTPTIRGTGWVTKILLKYEANFVLFHYSDQYIYVN